jgi:formylglycine-generating enzyme required for sulfatase activity
MVMEALAQRHHTDPFQGAERFLEYTDVRSGLLQASDAGDSYSFPHLTFQEYLTGLELVRTVDFVQHILARRTDDRWRVPIQLGLGHLVSEGALAMAYQLLSELVYLEGRNAEQQQRDVLFASELAADVGWERLERGGAMFKQLRRDMATALVPVVESLLLPAQERVQAGVLLGELGDPRLGVCTLPPAMVRIEGGEFFPGNTPETAAAKARTHGHYRFIHYDEKDANQFFQVAFEREINTRPLTLPSFEISTYLITNAQYKLFLDENGYDPTAPWWTEAGRAWLQRTEPQTEPIRFSRDDKQHPWKWNDADMGIARPNHPVVGVSWYEAVAFCRWLTQHSQYNPKGYQYMLPSEAEWEYAARGTTRRTYPWGNEPFNLEKANYRRGSTGSTSAVGCFPLGSTPEGIHDLLGNLWEWTRSIFRPYPYDPHDGREDMDSVEEHQRVRRGGSYMDDQVVSPLSFRNPWEPDTHNGGPSFRLVRYPT